jgi:hypothetical protein
VSELATVLALFAAAIAMFAINKPRLNAVAFAGDGTEVMEAANATIIAKKRGDPWLAEPEVGLHGC